MGNKEFWQWFSRNVKWLRERCAEDMASALQEQFARVIPDGTVEISNSDDNYEVILSASGQKALFRPVRELVAAAPKLQGFKFIALKPARGFDFVLTVGASKVAASSLRFTPLRANGSCELGIRIYGPATLVNSPDVDLILITLVETGIGEEAAIEISKLDCEEVSKEPKSALPLAELGQYISWVKAKRN